MPLILDAKTPIASAVSYVTPVIDPEALKNSKSNIDLNKHILSQTQGEAVLLTEDFDITSLMYITNVIHSTSPELVFVTKDGLKVQIFDFTPSPVIRDGEIITSFSILNKEFKSNKSTNELKIDIKDIWDSELSKDIKQKLFNCLQEIIKQSHKSNKVVLIGSEPAVLFLLTQNIISTKTKELWYQKDTNSKPVRIF